jgi:hypothetical protein
MMTVFWNSVASPIADVTGQLAQLRRLDDTDVTPISESGPGSSQDTKRRDTVATSLCRSDIATGT